MSLPHHPPHSSSPSKPSLQRTSNLSQPNSRSLLPSPRFDNDPPPTASISPSSYHAQDDFQEPPTASVAPPNFQPFFTLISSSTAREHFHPTVHYIFADDDADIVTEAALQALPHSQSHQDSSSQAIASSEPPLPSHRYLPLPSTNLQEHYLIVDIAPTYRPAIASASEATAAPPSFAVISAKSLSSSWQILRTNITQAPTIGDALEDESLMLHIEGRGDVTPDETEVQGKQGQKDTLEQLIERLQKGLDDIRIVIQSENGAKEQG